MIVSPETSQQHGRFELALLLCALAVYGAAFIVRTSFVVDGIRYFSLQDDGMVSMRYAKNLAAGYGLVWNPGGPRVQGYTNPLWVGLMAAVHILPIPVSKISLAVQIVALACVLVTVSIVRRLATVTSGRGHEWWPAVIMTATYLPLNEWSLQGSEVAPLTPLIAGAVLAVQTARERGTWSIVPYVLLAIAVLVRLDMAVPFAALLAFMVWHDQPRRAHHLVVGGGLLVGAVIAQLGFSWWYFGDPLPNTYYLKMTGYPLLPRLARGAWVMGRFLLLMCPGVALVALALWRDRSDTTRLPAAIILGQIAYSVYVGGDAWEWWGGSNRYVTVAMPLFFVLAGRGFLELVAMTASRSRGVLRRRIVECATLVALVIVFNETRGKTALREWLLIDRPMEVDTNEQAVGLALRLKEVTSPSAKIAVTWAGALPYFSERPAIDLLGKTDPVIAHQSMHYRGGLDFLPGHLKWDYGYSIGTLDPDVVVQLWKEGEPATPLLSANYEPRQVGQWIVFTRKHSSRIYQ